MESRLLLTVPVLVDQDVELRFAPGLPTAFTISQLVVGLGTTTSGLRGAAIVGLDIPPEAGVLQASGDGENFIDVPAVSDNVAFLAPETGRIQFRFVPREGFTGTLEAAIKFRAYDGQAELASAARGVLVPISDLVLGPESAVSADWDTARIVVEAVPEMPVLTPTHQTFDVAEAFQDGARIEIPLINLLAGISDPKTPFRGIAITGIDVPSTTGTFLVSPDGGQTLLPLPTNALSVRNAILLPFFVKLYFAPAPGFVGEVKDALKYRAWDATQGLLEASTGTPFDAGSYNSVRAFSAVEDSLSLNVVPQDSTSIPLNGVAGIAAGESLRVVITTDGRLTVSHDNPAATVTLRNREGEPIVSATGDGVAGALWQHVAPGIYWVTSNSPGQLTTSFVPGPDPLNPMRTGQTPLSLARGDVNQDGWDDLIVANRDSAFLSLYLGLSGGEFRDPVQMVGPTGATSVELVHLDADAAPELVWINALAGTVSVAWNDGQAGFITQTQLNVGRLPTSVTAGDLNDDGRADLVVTNSGTNDVSVFLSTGARTFGPELRIVAGTSPQAALIGDFDGDTVADLVIVNAGTPDTGSMVSFFKGRNDGTFDPPVNSGVTGRGAVALVEGDFNSDGRVDVAVANRDSGSIAVLYGKGDGTFQTPEVTLVGPRPQSLVTGDLNGDGRDDLLVVNESIFRPARASILLQKAGGGFETEQRLTIEGGLPTDAVLADFNQDSRLDVAVVASSSNSVLVLAGLGDGTFQSPPTIQVNSQPFAIATADFNNDGVPDLATVNFTTADVSILLGRASGGFDVQRTIPVFGNGLFITAADLNRDGRADLVVVMRGGADPVPFVIVLLGLGDGSFAPPSFALSGLNPRAADVADVNGDGKPDLVVVNETQNTAATLLGKGDGTFELPIQSDPLRGRPTAVKIGDFNGDQYLDVVTINRETNDAVILTGRGDGQFDVSQVFHTGPSLFALDVEDLDHDGRLEIIVADDGVSEVQIYHRTTVSGPYELWSSIPVPALPTAVLMTDVNGDGHADLITSTASSIGTIAVGLGNGDGTFQDLVVKQTDGILPHDLAVADFNGDRRMDVATPITTSSNVEVLFGAGDGTFINSGDLTLNFLHPVPVLVDLDADGFQDLVVTDRAGNILFHKGNSQPGDFAARVALNSLAKGEASLGVVVAKFGGQSRLVSLDTLGDRVSVYGADVNGAISRLGQFDVGGRTSIALAARDLNGDGRDDVVTVNPGSNTVSILLCDASGNYVLHRSVAIPIGGTALQLADVDGSGTVDVVVVTQFGSLVATLLNTPAGFVAEDPQRTGTSSGRLQPASAGADVKTRDGSAGVGVADFDNDGTLDLIVTNEKANTVSVLWGLGNGRYSSPTSLAAGPSPRQVRVGDFNEDGWADAAVLDIDSAQIEVFLNDGDGQLVRQSSVNAGLDPADFSVLDVNQDTHLDLVIGNAFGDLLTVNGSGDGTFSTGWRVDRDVPLVVADLDGDGKDDLVLANRALDRVSVLRDVQLTGTGRTQTAQGGRTATETAGLVGPGAVKLANLNDDNLDGKIDAGDIPDLVVANSSSNNVLVYFGRGGGEFEAAVTFFAGSRPVGLTISDVNGDGRPDLVTSNQGSNDVSILLNKAALDVEGRASQSTFIPGPRLSTGIGSGPIATTLMDVTGPGDTPDGIADLVVTNAQNGTLTLLQGIGGGFFNDQAPSMITLGTPPAPAAELLGGGGLVVALPQINQVAIFTSVTAAFSAPSFVPFVQFVSSFGSSPNAVLSTDFNRDGRIDLIIANNGDGSIAFLAGTSSGGYSLAELFRSGDLAHPSALALSGDGLNLYVTDEGEDVALVFDLRTMGDNASPVDAADVPPTTLGIGVNVIGAGSFGSLVAFLGNALLGQANLRGEFFGGADADSLEAAFGSGTTEFGLRDLTSLLLQGDNAERFLTATLIEVVSRGVEAVGESIGWSVSHDTAVRLVTPAAQWYVRISSSLPKQLIKTGAGLIHLFVTPQATQQDASARSDDKPATDAAPQDNESMVPEDALPGTQGGETTVPSTSESLPEATSPESGLWIGDPALEGLLWSKLAPELLESAPSAAPPTIAPLQSTAARPSWRTVGAWLVPLALGRSLVRRRKVDRTS